MAGIGMTSARTRDRLVQRLREQGITNLSVLDRVRNVPRHIFVDEALGSRAYEDTALPIGFGQTISQPYIVARMTEALLEGGAVDNVLEVGTGCGYQTAVLCGLCRRVYTIELHRPLQVEAEKRLLSLRLTNFTGMAGDGARGWPEQAPFDRIIVTAAPKRLPPALIDQLADDGVMVIPIGAELDDQWLERVTKRDGQIERKRMFPVRFVPLVSAAI